MSLRTDRAGAVGVGLVLFAGGQAFVGRVFVGEAILPWEFGGGLAVVGVVLCFVGAIGALLDD